jgi:oligoendopeptidase F
VYEGVRQSSIKGADDLDKLSQQIYSRYSLEPSENLKTRWMSVGLMYEDPFYDANYIYGALLALNFYEMYVEKPRDFVPRYIALMRNGFDASPEILLKRFLGMDLHDPRLFTQALRVVEGKLDLLEVTYKNASQH